MYSGAFNGLDKLLSAGLYAMVAWFIVALLGIPVLLYWLYQHISIDWV